jgi:flagellar basal-body rod protein FlgB
MQPVNLFDLAAQQARWLGVRQSAIAGNVANVNTPEYRAIDVESFERVLDQTRVAMMTTHASHLSSASGQDGFALRVADESFGLKAAGEGVVLEEELMKAGEVRRAFELNTAIVKAFHRMFMSTVRG